MNEARKHMIEFVSRVDDGRKLLSVSALAAGGAVIAISLVGLAYTIAFRSRTPIQLDIVAAAIGALISFIYLLRTAHVFERHPKDE